MDEMVVAARSGTSGAPAEVPSTDVAIIGAGPYGLAASAYLRAAGLRVRVFGEPMGFWRLNMPRGMRLRSTVTASHIADPIGSCSIFQFEHELGEQLSRPLTLEQFIAYGQWYQQQTASDLDPRHVARLSADAGGFILQLTGDETVHARQVVIAAGLQYFAHRPTQFSGLPPALLSHTVDHTEPMTFAGREVVVVGGSQSALEYAALLREGGADVEIIMRAPTVRWLGGGSASQGGHAVLRHLPRVRGLLYPAAGSGPPGVNWLVAEPDLFRLAPESIQHWATRKAYPSAGSSWLKPRLVGVPMRTDSEIVRVEEQGDRVSYVLSDGSRGTVDHVLLATGYRVDLTRYAFLDPALLADLRVDHGYPVLSATLESSVDGLYFVGAASLLALGPLSRFVAGTRYTGRALTRGITRATG